MGRTIDPLSRCERQMMDIVYRLGEATASDAHAHLPDPPSKTAVRTLLRILEDKGHLKHKQVGIAFVYTCPRSHVLPGGGVSAFLGMLNTFFDGSLEKAVAAFLGDAPGDLSSEEIERLYDLIRRLSARKVRMSLTVLCAAALPILFDVAFKGTVVLVVAFALTPCLGRASAGTRHLLWASTFVAILVIPIVSCLLPAQAGFGGRVGVHRVGESTASLGGRTPVRSLLAPAQKVLDEADAQTDLGRQSSCFGACGVVDRQVPDQSRRGRGLLAPRCSPFWCGSAGF